MRTLLYVFKFKVLSTESISLKKCSLKRTKANRLLILQLTLHLVCNTQALQSSSKPIFAILKATYFGIMFLRILSTLLLLTLSCLLVPITAPPPPPYAFYSDVFGPTDPDSSMSVSQLVESRGFALEQYTIATDDEYLLTVHRIVPRHYRPHEYNKARRPVLVSHGLFGSSTDFLINSPHLRSMANSSNSSSSSIYGDNFGFALLQTGRFDVWLTNSRYNLTC